MAFALCRIEKLHASNIHASALHNLRQRSTPNADPKKENVCIIGSLYGRLDTVVRERIGEQTIRKNAVLAVEILLSASPEYFRPDNPGEAGYWQEDKLNDFTNASKNWLVERYGDRIVRAHLHLDEATPHIHACLVPLDEKGKLNCRGLFGDREKLRLLQDSYAEAMSHLELERGIKGSQATYTQVKEYYNAVTQEPDLTLNTADIHHQLADRKRILKENIQTKRTVKALSKQLEVKDKRIVLLETGQEALENQVQHWQHKYQSLVNSGDKLSLRQVAWELGLMPVENQTRQWRNHEQALEITDTGFSTSNSTVTESGSALDLIMLINNCSFQEAILWLNDRFGEQEASQAVNSHTREMIKNAPAFQFTPPQRDSDGWLKVRSYLLEELKIAPALVDKLHREGLLYADKNQNLVCLNRSLNATGEITGATLTSTTSSSNPLTSFAPRGRRLKSWFYFDSGKEAKVGEMEEKVPVVLVDSPLDALAKATIDASSQKTRYLCLRGGSLAPWEFLRSQKRGTVTIALNRESRSQAMAHQIRQRLSSKNVFSPPRNLDWVTELKSINQAKEQNIALNPEQSKLFPTQGKGIRR